MAPRVRITDVSPRDGLQNEPGVIPTASKARLIALLCAANVDEVEIASFVNPKWVPQMGDAAAVCAEVAALVGRGEITQRPMFSALVPNERGLDGLLAANEAAARAYPHHRDPLVGKAAVFTAASEAFAQKNTGASIAETIERFKPVIARAHAAGLVVRGYLSTVIACPISGAVDPADVAVWSNELAEIGCDELDLGDTIGAATPETLRTMLEYVAAVCPLDGSRLPITLHLHDTHGTAAECVRVALRMGLRSFDSSAGGLGGCPYASTAAGRAPGNISTQALVAAIHAQGMGTGVRPEALDAASRYAVEIAAAARSDAAA